MNKKLCKHMKDKGSWTKDLCELCRNKHVCAKKPEAIPQAKNEA